VNIWSRSSIGAEPGPRPRSGVRSQSLNGKMRRPVMIVRRAGTVGIASGKKRLKRTPCAARASMFGVCTRGAP
jgi:hypothetical protein